MAKYSLKNPKSTININGEKLHKGNLTDEKVEALIKQSPNYLKLFTIENSKLTKEEVIEEIKEGSKELDEAREAYENLTGKKAGRKSIERLLEETHNFNEQNTESDV